MGLSFANGFFSLHSGPVRIGYSVQGSGYPLLLCPVPWGIDGHRWTMLDDFTRHAALVRFDPRGTGTSGDVLSKEEYGIPTLVDDSEAIRLTLGIARWNVMGQSAAGWTALEYTLRHHDRVNKLVIVCSAPTGQFHKDTFRDPAHPLYPEYERISKDVRALPSAERVKKFNRAIYQLDVQTDTARRTVDSIFAEAEFNPRRNQYFIMEELRRYNVTERLPEIRVPVLVIGGALDANVSPVWSKLMAEKIPDARLVMMEQSGHFPWLDEPESFFETVNEFLAS